MRIGLFLSNLDEEYQISIFKSIRERTAQIGLDLICMQMELYRLYSGKEANLFPAGDLFSFDGALLLSSVMNELSDEELVNAAQKMNTQIPVVSVGKRIVGIPSIIIKNMDSMTNLMTHLITFHKYKKFLYLGGPVNHKDNIVREHVFTMILDEMKLNDSKINYTVLNGTFSEFSGTQLMQEYMRTHAETPVDVIVCGNDNMAIGAYKALKMQKNPGWQSCAVTGFDDIPQAKLEVPALTTVEQPFKKLGIVAVDMLQSLLKGEHNIDVVDIESSLCLRNSCGCKTQTHEENKHLHVQEEMLRMRYNSIKGEQLQRQISQFGQTLNTVSSLWELLRDISSHLDTFDIHTFYMILFPRGNRYTITAESIFPEFGSLVLLRQDNKDSFYLEQEKIVRIQDFFSGNISGQTGTSSALIVKYLMSGLERMGIIIYESADNMHPHMCSSAVFVAHTLKRLRILQDEQERSRMLELEIKKRTKDLMEANNRRIEVEAEVLRISEMERQRFSTDLHDDICQRLAGISMLCKSISNQEESITSTQMRELSGFVSETLQRTRQYAHDSFPVELDSLGLNKSLGNLCNSIEKQTQFPCIYNWTATDSVRLTRLQCLNIFRIVQEAIHNVVKHSCAKSAEVCVFEENDCLIVKIIDDGIGIPENPLYQNDGIGLRSMQYRADQIGAEYSCSRNGNKGTCIEIRVPLQVNESENK